MCMQNFVMEQGQQTMCLACPSDGSMNAAHAEARAAATATSAALHAYARFDQRWIWVLYLRSLNPASPLA